MADKEDRTIWIKCDCQHTDHLLEIELDTEYYRAVGFPDEAVLLISPVLNHYQPWWRRIWIALKYVFKVAPRYSNFFDCVIVRGEDLDNLSKVVRCAKTINTLREQNSGRRQESTRPRDSSH